MSELRPDETVTKRDPKRRIRRKIANHRSQKEFGNEQCGDEGQLTRGTL
jgi:hypothetical protein